eukprot:CAMPEP_0195537536 /NCGR_PEP_ID=MMETSP0794_2-20130614/48083_1 /TAXON_ID=515487 /ORGANISM="Stephanopyxis turris, Strain CCMP 815" /LENGTH=127 /DNA_ID=CAMNT_0040671269 /DNA_START=35 /DNA_END=419 /DNA_ORIENTATION=-
MSNQEVDKLVGLHDSIPADVSSVNRRCATSRNVSDSSTSSSLGKCLHTLCEANPTACLLAATGMSVCLDFSFLTFGTGPSTLPSSFVSRTDTSCTTSSSPGLLAILGGSLWAVGTLPDDDVIDGALA